MRKRRSQSVFDRERVCVVVNVSCSLEAAILLDVKTWTNKIVGALSDSLSLDDENEWKRLESEDVFSVGEPIMRSDSKKSWSGRTTWACLPCSVRS